MSTYRIAEARKAKGISQQELAEAINSSQKQVHLYESGKRDPRVETMLQIARYLKTPVLYLLGLDSDSHCNGHLLPVFNRFRSKELMQAEKYQEVRYVLYEKHPRAFWLEVKGNSMNKLFPDGSLALIDPDSKVQNGDVCAIHLKDSEAILKRIYFENDGVLLCPESYDDQYPNVFLSDISDERRKLIIIGKAISYTAPDGWRA